jgi:DNA-binding HxlR family transcriptional regulator
MKSILGKLNPVFENRVRLAIMSVLAVSESADFNALKVMLDLTDGNLATHVAVLEKHRYVRVKKEFVKRKPQTTYAITAAGREAFAGHVDALEAVIRAGR